MALDAREIAKLRRIIAISEKLIAVSPRPKARTSSVSDPRARYKTEKAYAPDW